MPQTPDVILVVDDNEMNRDMLSRRLERHGYETATAENGRRALEMLQVQAFDLVLLDIMMPLMNGYELLEHIKKDPRLRHLPVIMISAMDDLDSVIKCIEMGAEDYLFKPFNTVLLKARISASLEKKHLHDALTSGGNPDVQKLVEAARRDVAALRENGSAPEDALTQIENTLRQALQLLDKA